MTGAGTSKKKSRDSGPDENNGKPEGAPAAEKAGQDKTPGEALKSPLSFLKAIFDEFFTDDCPRMAAALAYYTVFALPALLVLIMQIAGAVWQPGEVEDEIETQMRTLMGPETARQVRTMVQNASEHMQGGIWATLLGIVVLLVGATGAFAQLQGALNTAWNVAPDPERGDIRNFLMKRVLSFGMILCIAFLLLVSLVLSTVVSAFGNAIVQWLPGELSSYVLKGLDLGVSLVIVALLFAAVFKILPDAEITWSTVGTGAVVTAVLFVAGKFAIGFYIGQSDPGNVFGAAGSLALVLLWVYYSALIVFLGAEFTQVWARRSGRRILPDRGAVHVVRTQQKTSREEVETAG